MEGGSERDSHCSSSFSICCTSMDRVSWSTAAEQDRGREREGVREGGREGRRVGGREGGRDGLQVV